MKRVFLLLSISVLLPGLPTLAQDATGNAAAIAAKQDADERYKRMAADLQAVQSDNEALHAKITSLEQEIQSLRDAQAHPADNANVQDALKHLADKIEEVDKKRLEDKDAISEDIQKRMEQLTRALGSGGGPPIHDSSPRVTPSTGTSAQTVTDGYSYTIHDGDRLEAIVKAYNAEFRSKGLKTITIKQAEEANPKVDWNRLHVGQKIVIPRPAGG
jgi:cell division protein FtsB